MEEFEGGGHRRTRHVARAKKAKTASGIRCWAKIACRFSGCFVMAAAKQMPTVRSPLPPPRILVPRLFIPTTKRVPTSSTTAVVVRFLKAPARRNSAKIDHPVQHRKLFREGVIEF